MNGIQKNWQVVRAEWQDFAREQKRNLSRLKKPSIDPRNREHFVPHVLVAIIEETYDQLPRTLTYLTVIGVPLAIWIEYA
jgi:hypothetical protein